MTDQIRVKNHLLNKRLQLICHTHGFKQTPQNARIPGSRILRKDFESGEGLWEIVHFAHLFDQNVFWDSNLMKIRTFDRRKFSFKGVEHFSGVMCCKKDTSLL